MKFYSVYKENKYCENAALVTRRDTPRVRFADSNKIESLMRKP
jgi:hypothetical protein